MSQIILQGVENIAAAGSTANVLTSTRIVQCPVNGYLSLFMNSDGAIGEVNAEFKVNSNEILIDSPVGYDNRMPDVEKDGYVFNTPVRQGDRLTLAVRNTGAGANNFTYRIALSRGAY